jgi:hypothetical protein
MLLCDQPSIEKWSPDFTTSGLSSPVWTRVKYEQTVLCNSLEWTEWGANPVQVEICDACGTVGCASGGYVHVSALGDLVLWTIPNHVAPDDAEVTRLFPATALEKFGSVAFSVGLWELLRIAANEVPAFGALTHANGRALRNAWAVGPTRPKAVDRLLPMLRSSLIAADTLDVADAIQWIEHWLRWFDERAGTEVEGVLTSPESTGATIEKLYFDGPGTDDWVALAKVHNDFVPAFGPNHIFIPGSQSEFHLTRGAFIT